MHRNHSDLINVDLAYIHLFIRSSFDKPDCFQFMVDGKRLENLLEWEAGRRVTGDRKPEQKNLVEFLARVVILLFVSKRLL